MPLDEFDKLTHPGVGAPSVSISLKPDLDSKNEGNTLGELLYSGATKGLPAETEWQQLVHGMARGDAQALRDLHERSHRVVFTLLMRLVDNERTAEDLTLQTYQRAWQSAAQYEPKSGPVLAWLVNLARGLALKLQHERSAACIQYRQRLQAAVGQLTPEQRQLFELVYFSPFAIADAASVLGETTESVSERLHAVLQNLCEAFSSNKDIP